MRMSVEKDEEKLPMMNMKVKRKLVPVAKQVKDRPKI